jgi:hypothetical protein
MKYRHHRGGLKESMQTVLDIEPTINALAVILKSPPSAITVETYGYDSRTEWDTYLVAVEGRAVGFCNAFVEPFYALPLPEPSAQTKAECDCPSLDGGKCTYPDCSQSDGEAAK